MKIRLKLVSPGGAATTFEHAGPVIQIGRDPACELTLEGANSDGVSRQHARIELTAEGVTLTDVGSSNGTRLNGKLVETAMPLRLGDNFQLGFTGPTLTVIELELAASKATAAWNSWAVMAAGVAAAVVLLVGAVVYFNREQPQLVVVTPQPAPPSDEKSALPKQNGKPTQPPNDGTEKPKDEPSKKPITDLPSLPNRPADVPSAQIETLGEYLPPSTKLPLSVVLQRLNEQQLWTMLRPGDKVSSGHTLISLPGYRSTLLLNSGVGLLLDGNLPEFSDQPRVLESVVTLHKPPDGFHADLTVERGRVRFAPSQVKGPAKIRLRFLQEVWDMTLLDAQSEAAAMLWYNPLTGTTFGLITEGKVQLQKLDATVQQLPPRSFLHWQSHSRSVPEPETLPELPDWWANPKNREAPLLREALISLEHWQEWLKQAGDVAAYITEKVQSSQEQKLDSTHRRLGMHFLVALGRMNTLLEMQDRDALPDRVRRPAMEALWAWITQSTERRNEFERLALERYTDRTTVDTILKLLHMKVEDLMTPATHKQLVHWLGHDRLIVRQLAYWHLEVLHPEKAKEIDYDPTAPDEKRKVKVNQWHKAIP